jgi:membrane-bound inhibitor of C-type lysozyme
MPTRTGFPVAMVICLAGCAAPPPPLSDSAIQAATFTCDNGETVEMRFLPERGVGELVRGGRTLELQQRPAASGFIYSNGANTVRGKGEELRLEIGRMAPIHCHRR